MQKRLGLYAESFVMLFGLTTMLSCTAKQTTNCDDAQSEDCPTSPYFGGGASASDVKLTSIKPVVAKPGQEVTVTGTRLTSNVELRIGDQLVPIMTTSADTATFKMPLTPRPGAFPVKVGPIGSTSSAGSSKSDGQVDGATKFMISDSAGDAVPIYMATPDKICSPEAFRDAEGELRVGTKNCGSVEIDPWDLRAGVNVGGVTGKLKVNCRNRANSTRFNIDIGRSVTISGDTLTSVGHGLINGEAVTLMYTIPDYSNPPTTVSTGQTYYISDTTNDTFKLSDSSNVLIPNFSNLNNLRVHKFLGVNNPLEAWDTVDDRLYANGDPGPPPHIVPGWENNDCAGMEVTAGDEKVWKDVTLPDGVNQADCASSPQNCSIKDKITGLTWSRLQSIGMSWIQAIIHCDGLTHNGASDWRLPTQKEFFEAYNHGIRSMGPSAFIDPSERMEIFWSATTSNGELHQAIPVSFNSIGSGSYDRFDASPNVICVRP